MPGLQIDLGDVEFNSGTPDSNGVLWHASALEGWDSADLREDVSDKPFAHGLDRGTSYYGGRPMTLIGTLLGTSDVTDLRAARADLINACDLTDTDGTLTVYETPTKTCQVRRSGRVGLQQTGTHLLRFNIGLLAADPRKYETAEDTITVTSSYVTYTRPSSIDTPAKIRLEPSGSGLTVSFDGIGDVTITGTDPVTIDATTGTPYFDDLTLAWDRFISGNFINLPRVFAVKYVGSGSAEITYREAWA